MTTSFFTSSFSDFPVILPQADPIPIGALMSELLREYDLEEDTPAEEFHELSAAVAE